MGIGDQHHALACIAQGGEEFVRSRSQGDQVSDFALHFSNRQIQLARTEIQMIEDALDRTGGVVAKAAELLGLGRTTLVEKMKKLGIERH